ncbi:MAG: OsmC family protein [Actinomycetota bacterium]
MSTTITELNGVPVTKLQGTVAKLTDQPELARFRFTAKNTWIEGTATRSTMDEWHGVGTDHAHAQAFTADADHPTLGHGHGPTPHEYVLHGLAACLVAGVVTTAANRGIELTGIETVARGVMDVRGILGIDRDVRNGFSSIEVEIDVQGDASDADLDALVEASCKRSAVFDMLANPSAVSVSRAG